MNFKGKSKEMKASDKKIKEKLIQLGDMFKGSDTAKIARLAGVNTDTVRSCLKKGKFNQKVIEGAAKRMDELIEEKKNRIKAIEAIIEKGEKNDI